MTDDRIMALKRQLATQIVALADGMETSVAARRFRIGAPRLCDLRKGRISRFSVERLIRVLMTVDCKIDVTVIAPRPHSINWFPSLRARRGLLPHEIRRLEGKRRTAARMAEFEARRLARERDQNERRFQ